MSLLLAALAVWLAGGVACLFTGRNRQAAGRLGACVAVAGSVLALLAGVPVLVSGAAAAWQAELPWQMPFGRLALACDGLAALFVCVTALVTALAAIYGAGYLRHAPEGRAFGLTWFLFQVLTASMVVVFLAANAVLFLLAWEVMALSSFALVMFDYARPEVRRAGLIYFVATHLGTALLLVMFLLFGREAHGSLDFRDLPAAAGAPGLASTVFILALLGFGTKAGLTPMHVWLPEAHPAAPSHVSAVMSGVMIKTGLYGLLRVLVMLGHPPAWWGWTLIAAGAASALVGVLFALAQRDLKRMLAYSSVENIGIIVLGLGVALLGRAAGSPAMAWLGFAGALLHALNHALFKSLLFLGAGAVLHAAGTAVLDRLGGLLRRMPRTGNTFLAGSAAISGLPPFNGFISELLIFLGALTPLLERRVPGCADPTAGGVAAAVTLALVGALAVACFARAFGTVFLGEPREPALAARAHDVDAAMFLPMLTLAAACLAAGLCAPQFLRAVAPAVQLLAAGHNGVDIAPAARHLPDTLALVAVAFGGVLALAVLLLLLRAALLRGRAVGAAGTWDCGYAAPSARMQYSASSFAQPILRIVRHVVAARRRFTPPRGLFPQQSAFASETPDVYQERLYRPLFSQLEALVGRVQWMQHGKLNYYILAIVLALLALLAWKLR